MHPKIYQKSRDNLMQNPQEVQLAVEALRAALPDSAIGTDAPLGLILGTGLSDLAVALADDAGGAGFLMPF